MIKRGLDIVLSMIGLFAFSPPMIVVALLIKLDSKGPVLFRQQRIGRHFRPFQMFKFRTMVENAPSMGPAVTFGDDPRITRIGRFLRHSKFDELPQLINVFIGDMSLVGPRPEVEKYVKLFETDYEMILQVRPGITDLASIQFRNESEILGKAEDPEEEYTQRILPDKIILAKEYVQRSSLSFDMALLLRTLVSLVHSPT